MFGKPQRIYSDNGPQYNDQTFKKFAKDWGIEHITSSPHFSQSNGYVERHVGHIKSLTAKLLAL